MNMRVIPWGLSLLMVFLFAGNAFAQTDYVQHKVNRLADVLALTEDQNAAITAIFETSHTQKYDCLQTAEWQDCLESLKEETDDLIAAELVGAQVEIFEQISSQRKPRMRGRRGGQGQGQGNRSQRGRQGNGNCSQRGLRGQGPGGQCRMGGGFTPPMF